MNLLVIYSSPQPQLAAIIIIKLLAANTIVFFPSQGHWMTIPKFWPKPIPRLFLRYQIFRNRNRDFFPRPNFSETETDTFLPRPNFPKPKLRLFSETNFFRNRNRDFFSETKFFETETETLKNLAKVSRPRPKPRLLNIFWNEIRKIWDLQAKLEFLGPKFGTLIVNWVKIISAR